MKARKTMPMIKETLIELENHGQDFTKFYIDGNNFVVDVRWGQTGMTPAFELWKGHRIINITVRKGSLLRLVKDGNETVIKYPVIKVTRRQTIAT
jgi:hypothetical protein